MRASQTPGRPRPVARSERARDESSAAMRTRALPASARDNPPGSVAGLGAGVCPDDAGRTKSRPRELVADEAYDSQAFREWLRCRGVRPCIFRNPAYGVWVDDPHSVLKSLIRA